MCTNLSLVVAVCDYGQCTDHYHWRFDVGQWTDLYHLGCLVLVLVRATAALRPAVHHATANAKISD